MASVLHLEFHKQLLKSGARSLCGGCRSVFIFDVRRITVFLSQNTSVVCSRHVAPLWIVRLCRDGSGFFDLGPSCSSAGHVSHPLATFQKVLPGRDGSAIGQGGSRCVSVSHICFWNFVIRTQGAGLFTTTSACGKTIPSTFVQGSVAWSTCNFRCP